MGGIAGTNGGAEEVCTEAVVDVVWKCRKMVNIAACVAGYIEKDIVSCVLFSR